MMTPREIVRFLTDVRGLPPFDRLHFRAQAATYAANNALGAWSADAAALAGEDTFGVLVMPEAGYIENCHAELTAGAAVQTAALILVLRLGGVDQTTTLTIGVGENHGTLSGAPSRPIARGSLVSWKLTGNGTIIPAGSCLRVTCDAVRKLS